MGSVLAGVQEQCPDTTRPWAACSEPLLRPPARRGSNRALRAQLPTVLQYDPQFGDAFWNSSKYGMVTYLLRMMTSWAIVCSVWYLPPMTREVGAPPREACPPSVPRACAEHRPALFLTGRGRCCPVRQQSEVCHCQTGRARGPAVVSREHLGGFQISEVGAACTAPYQGSSSPWGGGSRSPPAEAASDVLVGPRMLGRSIKLGCPFQSTQTARL